ncbi:MAG: hypothetical protein KDK29_18660 [Sedimentitalea sp.]|nr:hypothetical protein [Sedimentitalea sp.]
MQVILHTGAHYTEDVRLLKCLLRNKQDFARHGTAVPGPGKYRALLGDAFAALQEAPPSPEAREVLIDAILDEETADRLILSNAHFFGAPRQAVGQGRLYPLAAPRMGQMAQLFGEGRIEMFMAIRNPATLIPALLGKTTPEGLRAFLGGADPRELRWSDTLAGIRAAVPAAGLTVWCHEDMPLIWAEVIRAMAGLEPGRKITGGFDLLASIMTGEGMRLFRAHLGRHPTLSDAEKRQVMADFLEDYALEEALEDELDLPGWTEAVVRDLTEIYEADLQRIAAIPGLRLIPS